MRRLMKSSLAVGVAVALVACLCVDGWAQGRGGRGGPGAGMGRMRLLGVSQVQKELGLNEQQIADVEKARDEMRDSRPGRGQSGERPNFQDMTQEERQKFREQRMKQMQERVEQETEKLNAILKPEQMTRLDEIFLQVRGAGALMDPAVSKKLGLDEQQVKDLRQTAMSSFAGMREAFQANDREKIQELRKEADAKMLDVLTDEQKTKFNEMKGKTFEMPEGAMRRGGRRGQGGPGGQGRRQNRPNRPTN